MGGFGGGMGPGNFATGMPPPSGFGGPGFGAQPPMPNMSGPGPSLESFQKDGFNLLGKQAIKKKEHEEGQKEFADLFNLADSKIKDRA